MHIFDISLSIKVFPTPQQKNPVMCMDPIELHSHNMCKEVLPKACLLTCFLFPRTNSDCKNMPCWVHTEFASLASQLRTCWSSSGFCSLERIASRPHSIPVLTRMVLLSLFLVDLLVRSPSEISSLRGYIGKYRGKLSLFSLWS